MFPYHTTMPIKETKIMNSKEIHNFNVNDEDIKTVQDFVHPGSVISSNGDCSQDVTRRLRLGRAAVEESGKSIKSKDVSLETKAKVTHTLVVPVTVHGCKRGTVKEADGKNIGSRAICGIYGYRGPPERRTSGS